MPRIRAPLLVAACVLPMIPAANSFAQGTAGRTQAPARARARPAAARRAPSGVVEAIRIEGNRRIDASTIRSYMLVQPGQP
ncbi:MAG: hypothetical protein JOY65_08935, partial [Acetobacteraceae bacterium]|nr:hypothetical protein [Acetobacteraceae bacterium]